MGGTTFFKSPRSAGGGGILQLSRRPGLLVSNPLRKQE
jgi:hypothetical protein